MAESRSIYNVIRNSRPVETVCSFISAHPYAILFLVIFFLYNINIRNIDSADTLGASLIPFAILDTHVPWFSVSSPMLQPENIVSFITVGDRVYPNYPIVTPVLVTPLYILPYLAMKLFHIPLDMNNSTCFLVVFTMEKIAASFITAAAITIFYAGLKEVVRERVALVTALVLAFCTSMWSINSQALWQHGIIAFLFSILFLLIVRNERTENFRTYILLGICSALLAFARPADLFLALPALVYVAGKRREDLAAFCIAALATALPIVLYNEMAAGNLFGGYGSLLSQFSFDTSALAGLAGVLISPNRGLLVFTPLVLLCIPGFLRIKTGISNPALQRVFYTFGIVFILEILVYGLFNCWWGGTTYGPRFFSGSLPMIFILVGICLESVIPSGVPGDPGSGKIILAVIAGLVIWSVFVQVVGVFYYPNGNWNDIPKTIVPVGGETFKTTDTSRLWDTKDTQIFRTFGAGPIVVNPVSVIRNLMMTGDIIDPSTTFTIRMGTELRDGWGAPEYRNGQVVRAIRERATVSVQYMRYSFGDNPCLLTLVASPRESPETLEILVNGMSAGNYPVQNESTKITVPITLKSSLRSGNNLIELKVPENCNTTPVTGTHQSGCIDIGRILISRT